VSAVSAPRVSLVADADGLSRLVARLAERPEEALALDTEADSFHHYFEKVCLVQLGAGDIVDLVDPLAVELGPLLAILARRPLLLHGADYDLRLLWRGYGFRPSRVFDTMIAAQLLGEKELGLAALLGKRVGVTLDKSNQRADWSERPLAPSLVAYAAADVLHLRALADSLAADLATKGRLEWHVEECERLVKMEIPAKECDPESDWRIKGTNALSSQERAFARALWHAREERAKETDRPSFRVFTNERLLDAAKKSVSGESDPGALFPGRPLPPAVARAVRYAVDEARALPSEAWPPARRPAPYEADPQLERAVDAMKKRRDARAQELGLDPGILAPRALLTAAARAALARKQPKLSADELVAATGMSRWRAGLLATA
jgi:ribonuclease D